MRDSYLPAFHACASEARAASVMCSYNSVNGTPACASSWLLQEQLRGRMQFGWVVLALPTHCIGVVASWAKRSAGDGQALPTLCCCCVQGVCGERLWGNQ